VSDLVPLGWWERLAHQKRSAVTEASLLAAAAMVQRGVPTVTVIVPRTPGVVVRARTLAEQSGIQVRADQIGTVTVTLKFSTASSPRPEMLESGEPCHPAKSGWRWLPGWAARLRRAARL
jgi:hypothetical protein